MTLLSTANASVLFWVQSWHWNFCTLFTERWQVSQDTYIVLFPNKTKMVELEFEQVEVFWTQKTWNDWWTKWKWLLQHIFIVYSNMPSIHSDSLFSKSHWHCDSWCFVTGLSSYSFHTILKSAFFFCVTIKCEWCQNTRLSDCFTIIFRVDTNFTVYSACSCWCRFEQLPVQQMSKRFIPDNFQCKLSHWYTWYLIGMCINVSCIPTTAAGIDSDIYLIAH